MPLEIKKRPKESSQALVQRFHKILKQSGILIRAREKKFKQRERSEEMKKRTALLRLEREKEIEKLRKLGKIN